MSSYTIELGEIIENGNNIFDFQYDFYEPLYKLKWQEKFIEHYFFNEIGFETIGRFKQRLRSRLNMIYPKYKQLYHTELMSKDIDFLRNKDLIETFERELNSISTGQNNTSSNIDSNSIKKSIGQQNNVSNTTQNMTNQTNTNNTNDEYRKQSNINNGLAQVDVDSSLTNEERNNITDNTLENTTNNTNVSSNNTLDLQTSDTNEDHNRIENLTVNNDNSNTKETTTFRSNGNIGVTSSAELLEKWRGVLIDIQSMMIDDCKDLFLMVY